MVDALLNVFQDYGWRARTGRKSKPMEVRLSRLADCLLDGPDGQAILTPTDSWEHTSR